MENAKVKEILSKQLELLAEVSEGKPENLVDLSAAMCEIADRLVKAQDPLCNDREIMSETIRDIFAEQSKLSSTQQRTVQLTSSQKRHR